jgi:hypothetical protein
MVLRAQDNQVIENLGHCPAESVEKLRQLLAAGAPAKADARRKDFYEVQNGTRVYWIHISPVSGRVVLLAIWQKPEVAVAAMSPQAA